MTGLNRGSGKTLSYINQYICQHTKNCNRINKNFPIRILLVDIDFENTAGFLGNNAQHNEAQFIVYFLSHTMMFCAGAMLEGHVVLTSASCVFAERYKFEVYGGTHKFYENTGVPRVVQHLCIHRGYNHSQRWGTCLTDNLAVLVIQEQYSFHNREPGSDYLMNRVRYGGPEQNIDTQCSFYGWGSRRNGFLVPLLIKLRRVDVTILPQERCDPHWQDNGKFLCIQQPMCRSEKYGALCPDDIGSVLVCSGFLRGMMISELVDRPCGTGFVDLFNYIKFLTCAVDGSRDVINQDDSSIDFSTATPVAPAIATPPHLDSDENEEGDKDTKLLEGDKAEKEDTVEKKTDETETTNKDESSEILREKYGF